MTMIKKIHRKNAINQIGAKNVVESQKDKCSLCGNQILNKKNIDGIVVCSNPKCPQNNKKEGL